MDMMDAFVEFLPEDVPTLPGFPFKPGISPKDFMKQVKEFHEMANAHMVEQADSVTDFCIQSQAKVCNLVDAMLTPKAEEKATEQSEPAQAEAQAPEAPAAQ
jgi:hypothetical protein